MTRPATDRLATWRFVAPAAVALVVIAAWQVWTVAFDVPAYLVPSPLVVARTLVADAPLLAASLGVTVSIALTALAVAVVAGVAIALLFVQSRWIEAAFTPYYALSGDDASRLTWRAEAVLEGAGAAALPAGLPLDAEVVTRAAP